MYYLAAGVGLRAGASKRTTAWAWPVTVAALGVAALASTPLRATQATAIILSTPIRAESADFRGEAASGDARRVADWVASSGDNQGLPFMIIDKVQAKIFVFNPAGRLDGASRALLGLTKGDEEVPGVGAQKLASIRPYERITPAGRFVARMGRDLETDVLWIDYAAALSLHRVVRGNFNDHRLNRLKTDAPDDKRISYGCVNVPAKFYDTVILHAFKETPGIVYILPEVKTVEDVFHISRSPAPDRGVDVRLGGFAQAPAQPH